MLNDLDVLQITVVMLGPGILRDAEERRRFGQRMGTEMIIAEPSVGLEELPIVLTMNRERVRVELAPNRASIAQEYPTWNGVEAFAVLVHNLVNCTEDWMDLEAIGYNIQLVHDLGAEALALRHLGSRLFVRDLPTPDDWTLEGGSAIIKFSEANNHLWTLTLDSRFNKIDTSKVFLDTNFHISAPVKPDAESVEALTRRVWQTSAAFVEALGK